MSRNFLEDYEPVDARLRRFWDDHPNGRIQTHLVEHADGMWLFRAEVFREQLDSVPCATGYAHEVEGSTPVNKTSAVENCETSAIGRALANAGYAAKGARPSREEMAKVAENPPPKASAEQLEQIRALLAKVDHTEAEIAGKYSLETLDDARFTASAAENLIARLGELASQPVGDGL